VIHTFGPAVCQRIWLLLDLAPTQTIVFYKTTSFIRCTIQCVYLPAAQLCEYLVLIPCCRALKQGLVATLLVLLRPGASAGSHINSTGAAGAIDPQEVFMHSMFAVYFVGCVYFFLNVSP
jgi:hypothetical protein